LKDVKDCLITMKKTPPKTSPKVTSRSLQATDAPNFQGNIQVGILGGGQLARMLALRAHDMGLKVAVLSEKADDPAAQVTSLWKQGSLSDPKTLEAFLQSCSVVTFESEFLDAHLLQNLAEKTGTSVLPQPSTMALIQDRLTQKELLVDNGLATAPFCPVNNEAEARTVLAELGGRAVFKKRRFGYDGYGTFVVRSEKELLSFLPELNPAKNPDGFIAESFVPFQRELAVIAVRSLPGKCVLLPFAESYQENSRCLWVKGPLKLDRRLSSQLKVFAQRIEKFLKKIDYAGAMGIEFFDTGRELLINELAPRVHNTGHYSIDGLSEDQFSLHLKAILGQRMTVPEIRGGGFAMLNLLGDTSAKPTWDLPADVRLHWYGKTENRPGRKMGHINATGKTPDEALNTVKKARRSFFL
jgi:5-(carboxyamino)imidazole ribonucleotide synthase